MEGTTEKARVCVTGAGGYLASWLVKLLLSQGYTVHGTVRDPSDEKNAHLKSLDNAPANLQLFKADLLDYNSLASVIAGCEGVFHVASPLPSTSVPNPEEDVLKPAVSGTLNVLKACNEAKVRRVVVVSSCLAVSVNPNWPKGQVMDEDCWSDAEHCRTTEKWYPLSKTLAEREAVEYAKETGLDVITLCPSLIIGPMLQSNVNASSLLVINNILKGARDSVRNVVWRLVDVRDVADALLLVYKNPKASGRYICCSHFIKTQDIATILSSLYPNYSYSNSFEEADEGSVVSSKKLQTLGWRFRPLVESLKDSVDCYQNAGLLGTE